MITKRVCELQVGDEFFYSGLPYTVLRMSDKKILFARCYSYGIRSVNFFGKNNQMKVEIVGRNEKAPEIIKDVPPPSNQPHQKRKKRNTLKYAASPYKMHKSAMNLNKFAD